MKRLMPWILIFVLLFTACTKPEPTELPEPITTTGLVSSVGEGRIVLTGSEGEIEIMIDDHTVYLDRGGQTVEADWLEPGDEVTVTYQIVDPEDCHQVGEVIVIESAISTQVGEGIGSLADCTEPPLCGLETPNGDSEILTAGTYEWSFPSGSGEMTGISACGVHPMDTPELLPALVGADVLYLHFAYTPQSITAYCWSGVDFGNPDATPMEIPCTNTSLHLEPGLNCYELIVTWQADNGTGGTAHYAFTANTLSGPIT